MGFWVYVFQLGADIHLGTVTAHKALEEFSQFRHDLSAWLAYKHIFDVWPPY